jgi:hypothetical protein
LDAGASVSATFLLFETNLQSVRQYLNTAPNIRGQCASVLLVVTDESSCDALTRQQPSTSLTTKPQ